MQGESFDLYDVLSLTRDASADDVKAAYRDLSRLYHPDKVERSEGSDQITTASESAFLKIHHAYRVLSDSTLRAFYDRYGLPGIRVAESLPVEEEEDNVIGLPDDALQNLERRVRHLLQRHEELRVQQLLGLNGSLTIAWFMMPWGSLPAHLRRRHRMVYSGASQTLQVYVSEKHKVTVGCATHVQGATGLGVVKVIAGWMVTLGSLTNLKLTSTFSGGHVDGEAVLSHSLSSDLSVQQKVAFSPDGCSMCLGIFPMLRKDLRGSLSWQYASAPALEIGLGKVNSGASHARGSLIVQSDNIELSTRGKWKPRGDFSLAVSPSASITRGLACEVSCSQKLDDGLTKLRWSMMIRRQSFTMKFMLRRTGTRFTLPLELWPSAAGPIPVRILLGLMAVWAAPPFVARLARELWQWHHPQLEGKKVNASREDGSINGSASFRAQAADQRQMIVREASRRRDEEVAAKGLVIVEARYGHPAHVASGVDHRHTIDVGDALMAKVRRGRLCISSAPKSSLLGFWNPCQGQDALPELFVRYRYGCVEYTSRFCDTDAVHLP